MLNDREIRRAMLEQFHAAGLRTVEEWYVGGSVVDVAVITSTGLFGYEIKGENDSLTRLKGQVENYGRVFDRCTLVVAQCHLGRASAMLPAWWGITTITEPATGGRHAFLQFRTSEPNPDQGAVHLASQLYARECKALLQRHCLPYRLTRGGRPADMAKWKMVETIAARLELETIRAEVVAFLMARPFWKADGRRTLGKDTKRPGVPNG